MTINLEDFSVDQDANGDYVLTYTPTSTVIERIDSGNEERILEVATQISDLKDATSGATVYDSSAEEVTADVNNQSVSTDDLSNDRQYGTEFVVGQGAYSTIQAAIDAVPLGSTGKTNGVSLGEVVIPATEGGYQENIDVSLTGSKLSGQGINTVIEGSGTDHAVSVTGSDNHLTDLWIDHTGTGSYDAIHITNSETRLGNIDIDEAPRNGIYSNSRRTIVGEKVQFDVISAMDTAIHFDSGANWGVINATIKGNNNLTNGVQVDGVFNRGSLFIYDTTTDGLIINGDANRFDLLTFLNAGTNALEIDGDENIVYVRSADDITLTSNSNFNRVAGVTEGTLTDNGTGNDTSDLITGASIS